MDKPNCKICGKSHWSHEPHVWSEEVHDKPKKKGKFDRVAYQREYMRKRRANEKERRKSQKGQSGKEGRS